ncbi:MAG: thiamine-phosphate kinase [Candidatus Bathyarchaeota archaeon]|nr:MAG: thiamine-phosphate kinase [Candidatus Bathyarchaeota archaeon]
MTTVGDVGERALIEAMLKHFTLMPGMPVPFWDDVMAVSLGGGRVAVFNTDMLVWETDVPSGMTHFQAARKAVVMNFSDLGAKGVRPQAFLASLGLPGEITVENVEEMARGFEAGAREYGGYVIGGDTNEAPDIIVSGVAFGTIEEKRLMKRLGAEPGDVLATTGHFGDTAAAFKSLLEGYEAPDDLRLGLLRSVYMPEARVTEGVALSESGAISASIDSSDGLAVSLYDLMRSSGVRFKLECLPVSEGASRFAELHDLDLGSLALYGGEEYELVFTVRPTELEKAKEALSKVGCRLIELGHVTAKRTIVLVENGVERPIEKRGWEHFVSSK